MSQAPPRPRKWQKSLAKERSIESAIEQRDEAERATAVKEIGGMLEGLFDEETIEVDEEVSFNVRR